MKIFLFIIATLLLCVNVQGKNNVVGDNIDVTHYEIHINNLDFDNKEMNATTLVSFQAMEDLSVINFELKNLEIEAITSEDLSIRSYTYENDLITITLNNTMTVGSNGTITINYSGKPFYENWGGVHWSGTYVFNLGVGFDSQPHNLGKTWFPCVDNFVDKATYDIFVTAVNGKKPFAEATSCQQPIMVTALPHGIGPFHRKYRHISLLLPSVNMNCGKILIKA